MKKGFHARNKILLGFGVMAITLAVLPMFAAFEAHVINVTAQIENALQASTNSIEFGTVFPQEYFVKLLDIRLSDSFLEATQVDDVSYVIKQKPKPRVDTSENREYCHNSEPNDPGNPNDPYYQYCYPVLCPYLSKEEDRNPDNDEGLAPFHQIGEMAYGYLSKSVPDIIDNWLIDVDVPCFDGQCAQDWAHQGWELDPRLEHQVFGCDLWIEMYDVSLQPTVFFSDNFGTGDNLNDIPNWEEEGEDSSATTLAKEPTSGNNSASPDGGRFALIGAGEWICQSIDASPYGSLLLGYYWRGDPDAEDNVDTGVIETQVGTDCESGVFINVATHELDDGNNEIDEGWSALQSVALSGALDNTTFALRFHNTASAGNEEFRVDAVTVTGTPN